MRYAKISVFILFTVSLIFGLDSMRQIYAKDELPANNSPEKRVELVTDQERGILSIQIDGELVAFLTKDGLHVIKNIEYGGTIADYGQERVKAAFGATGQKEAADEK
ncbi:hypothetical protein DESC_190024 [Desulfosarcina cetonica]|uniref:hypothetical protein n=1 Tax=Desulfosarcina cetonica TaxID=90730 RepID=UPI0006CF456A|nr:hypothetical protein [Desulfosarcina cetonica]VTR64407.1 hypothetical protein DESC_190024 [Desulfosarcina cetonica]